MYNDLLIIDIKWWNLLGWGCGWLCLCAHLVHIVEISSPESAQGLIRGVYPFCPYPPASQLRSTSVDQHQQQGHGRAGLTTHKGIV